MPSFRLEGDGSGSSWDCPLLSQGIAVVTTVVSTEFTGLDAALRKGSAIKVSEAAEATDSVLGPSTGSAIGSVPVTDS